MLNVLLTSWYLVISRLRVGISPCLCRWGESGRQMNHVVSVGWQITIVRYNDKITLDSAFMIIAFSQMGNCQIFLYLA